MIQLLLMDLKKYQKKMQDVCCTNILKVLVLQNFLTNPSNLFFMALCR